MKKKPLRVLAVDGDRKELSLLHTTLTHAEQIGVVVCMSTAKAAKDWLQTHQTDLILMELQLPDEDGIDLLYDLRDMQLSPAPHILVLSQYGDIPEIVRQVYKLGVDGILKKPYYGDRLLRRIQNVCSSMPSCGPERDQVIAKTVMNLRKKGSASGEEYLQDALRFILAAQRSWRMKDIYNDIMEREDITYPAVETAMRGAVTRIFQDRTPTLETLLELTGKQGTTHMACSDFLHWLAIAIKLQNHWE